MKTQEKLVQAIQGNKELSKAIEKISYYDIDRFLSDARRYIKAIQEGRMICNIVSVSASGMSRNMKFLSMEQYGKERRFSLMNYNCLFLALGYTQVGKRNDSFRIGGCGMDMVFATNYNNIHDFMRIGLITKDECAKLAQMTPQVV